MRSRIPMVFLQGLTGLDEAVLHDLFHRAQDLVRSRTRRDVFRYLLKNKLVLGDLSTEFERTNLGECFGIRFRVELTLEERAMQRQRLEFIMDERDAEGPTRPCGQVRSVPGGYPLN